MELNRYKMAARFGMMHMIATNMCEWIYILVEETKHEIVHLQHDIMSTDSPICKFLIKYVNINLDLYFLNIKCIVVGVWASP